MERDLETYLKQFNRLTKREIINGSKKVSDLEKYLRIFKNEYKYKDDNRIDYIPDVPELEISAGKHRLEDEMDVACVRQKVLPVSNYFPQTGKTCGLTAFMLILSALEKRIPTYEEIMGVEVSEINGSDEYKHRDFTNSDREYKDIKETKILVQEVQKNKEKAREAIFEMLGDRRYLYVLTNWQKLHGRRHPDDRRDYDHAIVLHGVRETAAPIQKDKVNYLITDPNHHRYHNIWISETLLFRSFTMESAEISAYTVSPMTLKQKLIRKITGVRPVNYLQV